MGGLTTNIYFLTVLEPRSLRSGAASKAPGEGPLPGLQTAPFSLCPHMAFSLWLVEKEREDTSPREIKPPPLWPHLTLITSLKAQIQLYWELGLQYMNFGDIQFSVEHKQK